MAQAEPSFSSDAIAPGSAFNGVAETAKSRSIPSLDGLRAISITLVIMAHNLPLLIPGPELWRGYLFELGQTGVSMFFVISGFLITFLLEKEQHATGTIHLRRFYLRRAFRIFPPFYVFLAVLGALWAAGVFQLRAASFIAAATYTWNYYIYENGGYLGHTWSLSLEEQFYCFWPWCLKRLRRERAIVLALVLIAAMPFSRLFTYLLFPIIRGEGKISAMFHARIDTMMFGCVIALLWKNEQFAEIADRYMRAPLFVLATAFTLCIGPYLSLHFHDSYHAFYYTFSGAALAAILLYVVRHPRTPVALLLNTAPLRYIGRISYSLYLWQQLFGELWLRWFPLNIACAFGCALASYYLVERPSLRWRDAVERRMRTAGSAHATQ